MRFNRATPDASNYDTSPHQSGAHRVVAIRSRKRFSAAREIESGAKNADKRVRARKRVRTNSDTKASQFCVNSTMGVPSAFTYKMQLCEFLGKIRANSRNRVNGFESRWPPRRRFSCNQSARGASLAQRLLNSEHDFNCRILQWSRATDRACFLATHSQSRGAATMRSSGKITCRVRDHRRAGRR